MSLSLFDVFEKQFEELREELLEAKWARDEWKLKLAAVTVEEIWQRLGTFVEATPGLGEYLLAEEARPTFDGAARIAVECGPSLLLSTVVQLIDEARQAVDADELDHLTRRMAGFYFLIKHSEK